MSYLGTRNAVALGVSQHMTLGGSNLLETLSPSLLLQFVGAETLDPRITFTRASTATFTGSNGLIQTAAINAPRFDYDPTTLASLGLLIEEQRTNLLTHSEQFADAAWTKTNSTITANAAISPNGAMDADKHIPNNGATIGTGATSTRVFQTPSLVLGTAYTLSFYAKAAEFDQFQISVITAPTVSALYSLTAGTVLSGTGATITNAGNGWYRCIFPFTSDVTGTLQIRWSAQSSTTSTGNGTSGIFIWGAQLEVGAFATSYIPTVASQVTRAADNAVMTGTNFSDWYNATEGTLYSEASTYDVSSARTGFGISDNTAPNRIQTGHGSGARAFISAGGVTQMNQTLASVVFSNNTASKVSLAYLLNNGNAAANGTLGTLDTAMTIPVVTQAQIGGLTASLLPLNGTVRQIVYYPRRLTDAELQAITS